MDIKKIIGLGAITCLSSYLFLAAPFAQAVFYFQYHTATTAEGWTAGTDDSRHVRPLGEKFDFFERERIQFFGQAGRGWDFSNFYPANYNSAAGNYKFKLFLDTGTGYQQIDAKTFTVS